MVLSSCKSASFPNIAFHINDIIIILTSQVAPTVKNLPAMQETRVGSLGREDPLEKEMATHSSIFAWRIPWAEEPGGLQPWWATHSTGPQRVRPDRANNTV